MYEYQAFKLGTYAFQDKSIAPDFLVEVLDKVINGISILMLLTK